MKLSTRTRYGTRAILELALHYGSGPLQTRQIAERHGISVKYLEQLMGLLRSTGLIRSVRGAKGGYLLARPPSQIRVGEVFRALEGSVLMVECLQDRQYCRLVSDCIARQLWARVQQGIDAVIDTLTLQDLIEQAQEARKETFDYQI